MFVAYQTIIMGRPTKLFKIRFVVHTVYDYVFYCYIYKVRVLSLSNKVNRCDDIENKTLYIEYMHAFR